LHEEKHEERSRESAGPSIVRAARDRERTTSADERAETKTKGFSCVSLNHAIEFAGTLGHARTLFGFRPRDLRERGGHRLF